MAGMDDPDGFCDTIREVIEIATVEDKEMVERIQVGCGFASDTPGLLHGPLELNIKEFNTYVAGRLSDA